MDKKKRRRLAELVRCASPEVILNVARICDGHGILKPEALLEAGFPPELIDHLTVIHQSDFSDPKSTIFVNGQAVKALKGVYGLQVLEFLADVLEISYPRCFGRGSQARSIQQALIQHFEKSRSSGGH